MTRQLSILAAAMLALLLGCAGGPERVVERRYAQAPAPRGAALLRDAMLAAHDAARTAVGVPPLRWDARLAADAQLYAAAMARTGRFEHAHQPQGPGRQGENLWTGTRGAYRYAEMVAAWADERRDFINRPTPGFSRTGRWQDVAHYTQMIWRDTTTVGCAVAAEVRDEYLVCRYSPAGNVMGRVAF